MSDDVITAPCPYCGGTFVQVDADGDKVCVHCARVLVYRHPPVDPPRVRPARLAGWREDGTVGSTLWEGPRRPHRRKVR